MSNPNFVDYIKVLCRSGNGGSGSAHFLRTKSTAMGGPDGGDGGRGGHVILRGNGQLWTLLHLRYTKHIFAENAQSGSGTQKTGADGNDFVVEVPLGTIAKNAETGEVMCEVTQQGESIILLKGGRGGQGNAKFKTATRQTPRFAQEGEPFIETLVILELKLLADVGLVGFPNAGKSTLLSVLSAAKPEIADYPFTTLRPNLGIVSYRDNKSFVMADIPGIIQGAHLGKGLGLRFLRHIERNSVLLFMIPIDNVSIKKEFNILINELKEYNPELLDKPRILAITKTDIATDAEIKSIKRKLPDIPTVFISSVEQKGLAELKDLIWSVLNT